MIFMTLLAISTCWTDVRLVRTLYQIDRNCENHEFGPFLQAASYGTLSMSDIFTNAT